MTQIDVQEENLAVNFDVQFWGVRSQIAAPGKDTIRYGGNTSCVEMRVGEQRLIFDGGTGLRQLGNSLLGQMPLEVHMFFTHCHWDRIQGFPFFVPAFIAINHLHIYGASASNGASFKERLHKQMLGPNFPVPMQVMQSKMEFYDMATEKTYSIGEVEVEAKFLDSAHRSLGYRINYQGKSVVYATGSQYVSACPNQILLTLSQGADLLIVDAPAALGNCNNGARLEGIDRAWRQFSLTFAKEAGVKQVVLSLYSPDDDDDLLEEVEKKLKSAFLSIRLAQEGMVVSVL
jgi:phosphoribosyl 1,2-cyclic phosphodiesterase